MLITNFFKQAALLDVSDIHFVVVLAPHPDDESLACGGLIAMLKHQHKKVFVMFITDGSFSHPNSKKYPAAALAAMRKEEAVSALKELNVEKKDIFFLNKKDGALPAMGEPGFKENAEELFELISFCKPDLVLLPYEKDPHTDHRATWQMLMHIKPWLPQFLILEYFIWLYNLGEEKDLPGTDAKWLELNISNYTKEKRKAIYKHVSQTTRLIDDDADGFILTDDVLLHFITEKEYFLNRNL